MGIFLNKSKNSVFHTHGYYQTFIIPIILLLIAFPITLTLLSQKSQIRSNAQMLTSLQTANSVTTFTVSLCPHELGNCGDNVNPHAMGNIAPKHQSKIVVITFYNNANKLVATIVASVLYSPSSQNFTNTIKISNFPSGMYTIKLKMNGYLTVQYPGNYTVNGGGKITLPSISLIAGDVNNDNVINVLDYNAIISCFGDRLYTSSCLAPINSQSSGADLNDDNSVDGVDYNIFIRELTVQQGPGGGGPSPTSAPSVSPTSVPSVSPTPGNCVPNAILVNPCRPWFGAAARGNPGAANNRIAQFTYLETLIGHQMDLYHEYDQPNTPPLSSDAIHFATRPNTYIYVNWKPASNWAAAGGSNATVNAEIDKAAANIKKIAPRKIFLTVWHEPENDVSPGTASCPGLKGSAGSPAQYKAMWQNVRNRFNKAGVNNVVWVMNYMNYRPWQCLVPQLWPGNNLVDWVTFEAYNAPYDANYPSFTTKVGDMYNLLTSKTDATHAFTSKPWGLGEFGDCKSTDQSKVYAYYDQMKAAIDTNTFPRLKLFMVYADTGNNAGPGCLTNYTVSGSKDSTEQIYFNHITSDPIFKK